MKRANLLAATSFADAAIRPLHVGRRLWIAPAGEPAPGPDLLPIWLEPGPAFGSGAHPSTQLCLLALERRLPPGSRVLDLGTGTGILAVAAARLGAAEVVGIDIDPAAVEVAQINMMRNKVADRVRVTAGTLAGLRQSDTQPFSWVIVNILAHIIGRLIEEGLGDLLTPGGWLVLSGFLRSQTPVVRAAVSAAGLTLLAQEQQDDWVCIIAQKPDSHLLRRQPPPS